MKLVTIAACAALLCPAIASVARADIAPEPPPSPSIVVKGEVAVLLPDGFVIRDAGGGYTLVETICPAFMLGLERGDSVSVFGGPTPQGIASGAITLLLPGYELPLRDGFCR